MAANRNLVSRENQPKVLLRALVFEFGEGELVERQESECSAEISMRNPRACGSLAQHSGVFVFIFCVG